MSLKKALFRVSGVLVASLAAILAGCGDDKGTGAVPPPPPPQGGVFPPESVVKGSVTDGRDGKKYNTVKIGGQTWMAQNLNVVMDNSWCYDDDDSYCAIYGRLYTWNAAKSACEGLGGGWHLPSKDEWDELVVNTGGAFDIALKDTKGNVVGTLKGYNFAGKRLKSKTGWKNYYEYDDGEIDSAYGPIFVKDGNGYSVRVEELVGDGWYNVYWYSTCWETDFEYDCQYYNFVDSVLVTGTDDYGFSALPGGARGGVEGSFYFYGVSTVGYWWSATELIDSAYDGIPAAIWTSEDNVEMYEYAEGIFQFSARCVKD